MAANSEPASGTNLGIQCQDVFAMPPAVLHSGMCQSYQAHLSALYHVAPATKKCTAVNSNVAVPFAIAATACKTEQTRWQMHLGKLQDSPLYRLSITCWGTHRASADCLRVLALCQMQPNWIHPCRVCIRQYSSQCQRDPHLFRDTGHGGSHSRVGVHACPAEAL